ncbi:MAG: PTS sugar transporter subunit IIA [Deltaproteobacteria bacterium]|nr:PTS sugar transporter subunit IIA [Deltaproteobacteria bacterium]
MPMLRLADYLQEDRVLWELPSLDKPSFLKALAAEAAARIPAVDEEELLARLLEREEERSTGVGGGLALPHARVSGLERTVLLVGRVRDGLDFGAPDGRPVDLLFVLLSPADARSEHLRLLARVARIFAPEGILEKLRAAPGPKQLFQLLLEEDARHVY